MDLPKRATADLFCSTAKSKSISSVKEEAVQRALDLKAYPQEACIYFFLPHQCHKHVAPQHLEYIDSICCVAAD
jgi:hypothetical protein